MTPDAGQQATMVPEHRLVMAGLTLVKFYQNCHLVSVKLVLKAPSEAPR